ncbi:uncharacterized protein CBL_04026 [Carabus blaptoides fortunei]
MMVVCTYPVKHISFANEQCLTSSVYEAIIFDLKTCTKVHELSLQCETALKQVTFMPITNDILICFCDDFIHVWKSKTFERYKQILPTEWNQISLRCIAITRNGTSMILAGYSSSLIVFSLDTWQILRILNLPAGINSVKSIQFISQEHDGGANKFLIILSTDGVIYFLDMENSIVLSKIQKEVEIISFTCSPNGVHLACVLHSGEVNVYKIAQYIEQTEVTKKSTNVEPARGNLRLFLPVPKQTTDLDLNKLRGILTEYGEYPESYRSLIWTKILQLPNNQQCYRTLSNKGLSTHFKNLEQKYPMMSKSAIRNMKRLLSNLGNWCSIFYYVDFIPLFAFPFLKIFENDPLTCFEAVISIILNWCQHWFEYIPYPPMNILVMIESVLKDQDPQLISHLAKYNVTSHLYAWPLLEVAFSEILSIKDWCALWDNILSNEPSFLLMVVAAYSIVSRSVLLSMTTIEEFEIFYHQQNPTNMKKLINKAQYLLNNTSPSNHPRQYLKDFTPLPKGSYPVFDGFPKIVTECEDTSFKNVMETEDRILKLEEEVSKYKVSEEERQKDMERREEEAKRLQLLEDLYQEKMLKEKERIDKQRLQLSRIRTSLHEKQAESLEISRKRIEEINLKERQRELSKMLNDIDQSNIQADFEIQQTEEELSKHYVELLKQKEQLESLLLEANAEGSLLSKKSRTIDQQRQQLNKELDEIRRNIQRSRITSKVKVPMSILVLNDQIQNLDFAAAKEMAQKQQNLTQHHANMKLLKMENDTKELEKDVQRLLNKLTNVKVHEARKIMSQLNESVVDRKEWIEREKQLLRIKVQMTSVVDTPPEYYYPEKRNVSVNIE